MVRQGRKEDMAGVLALIREVGWSQVIDHVNLQFDLFPVGVFVAESSEGEIISRPDIYGDILYGYFN